MRILRAVPLLLGVCLAWFGPPVEAQVGVLFSDGFEAIGSGELLLGSVVPAAGSELPADAEIAISGAFVPFPNSDAVSVSVRVNNVEMGLAAVSDSQFTLALPAALPEGEQQVSVTITQGAIVRAGSWQFTTRSEPGIDQFAPFFEPVPPATSVLVGARVRDVGSGLEMNSLRLLVDGVDRTSAATWNGERFEYSLPAGSAGQHQVDLHVSDRAGNQTRRFWTFNIGHAPVLNPIQPPPDARLRADAAQTLEVRLQAPDTLTLDPSSLRVWLDGELRADLAQLALDPSGLSGRVQATLPELPAGVHSLLVSVASSNGLSAETSWSFEIVETHHGFVRFTAPGLPATVLVPEVLVVAEAGSDSALPVQVTINGQRAEIDAATATTTQARYQSKVALAAGANTVQVVALFTDGTDASVQGVVDYDPPAIVSIDAPIDFSVFGPLPNASGNATQLTGAVQRSIAINGRTSRAVSTVQINQQAAEVSADGQSFRFEQFFLHEGTNHLTVTAKDELERVSTASITVYVDQTAPLLSVNEQLSAGFESATSLSVRGFVHDVVAALVNRQPPIVTVRHLDLNQIVTAAVSQRQFLAPELPLSVGRNRFEVKAMDVLGNSRTSEFEIFRVLTGSKRLLWVEGQNQAGPVESTLPEALKVQVIDSNGNPIAGQPIDFDVRQGTGSLSWSTSEAGSSEPIANTRRIRVNSDSDGLAAVRFRLGRVAGAASDVVDVAMPDAQGSVEFVASAEAGLPSLVLADGMSASQYLMPGASGVEPLVANVYDQLFNPLADVSVRYRILAGDARIEPRADLEVAPDGQTALALSDSAGVASVRIRSGDQPGVVRIIAEALVPGQPTPIGQAGFQVMVQERGTGDTRFVGVIMNHAGQPLPNVQVSIGRTPLVAMTDAAGRFVFEGNVPAGKIDLFVDGRDAPAPAGQQYPSLHFESAIIPGQVNQLPHAIYLPPVQTAQAVTVGGSEDVVIQVPGLEGFQMRVKANSVTFPDGSRVGPLSVSMVNADRLPMVPQGGLSSFGGAGWTIQPSGTRFDPPIEVTMPNATGLEPGYAVNVYQWDHDLATFVPMGLATVTEDGSRIVTQPGTGISKAGWGGGPPPVPPNDACGDPGEPDLEQCLDFANLVERCPRIERFEPKMTITTDPAASDAGPLIKIADDEYSALSSQTFGFQVSMPKGDPQYVTWSTEIRNSNRVLGFDDETPADRKGATYSLKARIERFSSGSTNESPPIHFDVKATLCGTEKVVVIKNDIKDIIRQEYEDARVDVPNFNLSTPVRSRLVASTLYTPNATLSNPYLINHGISLDDPSGIARAVANAFQTDLRQVSVNRYQQQLAQTANPAQQQQIRDRIQQVMATPYQPTMTSAWRSPRHNRSVGGVACSNHVKGGAVDMVPPGTIPPNITVASNEHWCALRRACATAGYNECLLELPRATGDGWNGDHACTANTTYNAVHSGQEAPCS